MLKHPKFQNGTKEIVDRVWGKAEWRSKKLKWIWEKLKSWQKLIVFFDKKT